MFGWLSAEAARASCAKRPRRSRIGGEALGQELDRDVAVQLLVMRPPDLAHPAAAEAGHELAAREPHADGGRQAWSPEDGA